MFLPVLVNPTAPRTIGANPIAPVLTTVPIPTAFRRRIPEKFTKRYHTLVRYKEGILSLYKLFVFHEMKLRK